jgi:hypothetical protein
MKQIQNDYRSYLLRLWRQRGVDQESLHATLEDVMTSDLMSFASLDALFEYLLDITSSPNYEGVDTEERPDRTLE